MKEIELRPYQADAINLTMSDLLHGYNPVIGLPTGSGKSIVLCGLADAIISADVNCNILIISHVKEILEQNYKSLTSYFGGFEFGLYSSGLKSKTISKITVASIQTIQNCPEKFTHFTHAIIDEAHRVGFDDETGYRKFLNYIDAQCIGLTATPFRMKGGYIYSGENSLFDKISIDMTTGENFNSLIEDGYLSEIYSKKTALMLSDRGIKTVAGDFSTKDLSDKFDRDNITEAAVLECVHFGKNYHSWLCFSIDIKHAENITETFKRHGVSAAVVHSKMKERDKVISDFKKGVYKVLVNVDILTTGFDHPAIDLIIMLRHTKSPIIHVQTIGRGLRVLYDNTDEYDLTDKDERLEAIENSVKTHCLVLDFAGNAKRLGAINNVKIRFPGDKLKSGEMLMKTCPSCEIENILPARVCCNCGEEFLIKEKIQHTSHDVELVQKKMEKKKKVKRKENKVYGWATVSEINYNKYSKNGKDLALVVEYKCGMVKYKEFVFIGGNGFSKYKAINWIKQRIDLQDVRMPETVDECLSIQNKIKKPKEIFVDANGRYVVIINCKF